MPKFESPFAKDIKRLIMKIKSGKGSKEDEAKLEQLRTQEKEFLSKKGKPTFKPGNDFSWWNKVPELLRDAANLKSNWIAGMDIAGSDLPYTPPGAVRIKYESVYGISDNPTDPLNVWSRDLYLRMFQKWRGISAYSQSDLGISIIGQIEISKMIAKLERIYGVINRYSRLNINMPFTEVGALGLTLAQADYIRGHLSDFRYDLNELIRKAQRLCLPKDISLVANGISLLGYEYLDHDNVKAQIIVFDTEKYGIYTDTALSTGGAIQFTAANNGLLTGYPLIDTSGTANNMFPALQKMLDELLGSSGIQRIFGDLVTWFGQDQMLEFKPLEADFIVAPVYSEEILHKMHNLESIDSTNGNVLGGARSDALTTADKTAMGRDYWVYQVNDAIISKAQVYSAFGTINEWSDGTWTWTVSSSNMGDTYLRSAGAAVIDTYRIEPTDETITEGVLFKHVLERRTTNISGTTYYFYQFESVAFEVITGITLYTVSQSSPNLYISSNVPTSHTTQSNVRASAGQLAVLDWAPLCYMLSNAHMYVEVYGDIDTPIPVYRNTISKLHRAVVYSGVHTDIHVVAS